MDRNKKKKLREYIGEHLDVSSARLTDDEAIFLRDFIDEYDETYKGRSETRKSRHVGWSSDGKYTRSFEFTDTFTDDIGIRHDHSYRDDDGQAQHAGVVTLESNSNRTRLISSSNDAAEISDVKPPVSSAWAAAGELATGAAATRGRGG
jgi:hypothetical protein